MENKQYSPRWEVDFSNPNANNITTGTTIEKPMKNKQQTAVQWLYHKLSTCTSDEMVGNINKWFEEAKQREKEQIIDAWDLGRRDIDYPASGEQYYTETYNK